MLEDRLFVCDAYDAGFDIEPVNLNTQTKDGYKDLKLTREKTDYNAVDRTSLFSINGLICPSVVKEDGIYLVNGYVPIDERILIIRTNQLSDIEKIPVTEGNILNPYNIDTKKEQAIYIKTDFNLMENFYLVVIAGFLFIADNRIEAVKENELKISQISLDLDIKYLFSSFNFRNDSVTPFIPNDKTIDRDNFYDFETLKNLFKLPNSFIVKFNKKLICEKKFISSHKLPGKLMTDKAIDNLLISESQKIINYKIGGNRYHQIIEGQNLITGLARSKTTVNDKWTVTDIDPPYNKKYEEAILFNLRKF